MRVLVNCRELHLSQRFFLSLICFCISSPVFAVEEGDSCTSTTFLEPDQACFQDTVYSCPSGGRMGYVACGDALQKKLDFEANRRYEQLLKKYERPDAEGMKYAQARVNLDNARKAWESLTTEECNLVESLFGLGNGNAGVMVDCYYDHTKEWIRRLMQYEKLGYFPAK